MSEKPMAFRVEFGKMVRFGLVGVLNTAVGLGIIFLLYNVFHVDYRVANGWGYAIALINSFFWNKHWTFASNLPWLREAAVFLLVFFVSYGANFLALLLCVEKFGVNANLSQVIANVVYTTVNFLGNRWVTFR